ncbi:hypothetical protein [Kocuria sp. HSID16901]|uniref:hypothetical protein n=1 Tax=Kocuria sp. HSID16901 TaxID=2419505 RepID=UPI00065FF775|nr:hypothetical protein [Kocuria sp. HSID16901]MCT1367205.1 hypothetical protein [Rothia sp. p3-SID1597]RUQ23494.1 hypothetical protein D8M21_01985 [Kocuria sp. HSID16901]
MPPKSIYTLLAEHEASLNIAFAQRFLEYQKDRVNRAHREYEEAMAAQRDAENYLDELCAKNPNVRPPQHTAAEIVKGHQEQ